MLAPTHRAAAAVAALTAFARLHAQAGSSAKATNHRSRVDGQDHIVLPLRQGSFVLGQPSVALNVVALDRDALVRLDVVAGWP